MNLLTDLDTVGAASWTLGGAGSTVWFLCDSPVPVEIEPMRDALIRIAREFPSARERQFGGDSLAEFIRSEAAEEIRLALGELAPGLLVKGSAGAGNWSEVPWVAVFDPFVTTSATLGYYVVYLFSARNREIHLSLNQGTTAVRREFKSTTREILQDRAVLIRARIPEYVKQFEVYRPDLESGKTLPKDYEAGHACGRRYSVDSLPTEAALRGDLQLLVRASLA